MIGPFGHLGSDACALADGSLDATRTVWAEAHIARCQECADTVREQRRQRRVTSSLGEVEVPTTLQDRLLALSDPGPDRQERPDGEARPAAAWATSPAARSRWTSGRLVAVAAVSVLGVGIAASGSLMAIGAARTTSPERLMSLASVDPAATRLAATSTAGPDVGHDAWPAGWTSPGQLPVGTRIVAVHDLDTGDLRVDLAVDGVEVTVLESHGVLSLADVPVARSVRVGDLEAHLVGDWWIAQGGSQIVAVTAPDRELALAVIREFDASGSAGMLETISRGWQVVAGG